MSELNQIVGVEVSVQDGGTYNITMANGYSLVQGSTARQLAAVPSSADPSLVRLSLMLMGRQAILRSRRNVLNTGSLGGILTFRSQDLDQTRNTLGQLALAFAEAFNTQHKAGFDANGDEGEDFFAIGKPAVLQNTKNNGNVAIGATVTDASAVLANRLQIVDNNQWQVTRLASNTTFTVTPDANGKVAFDGLELTFTGTPAVNDSFTLKPVSDAIVNMDVLITDEAKIAMVSEEDAGDSDNRNGQALLDLQSNSKTVGGAKSFNDAYASLVSDIGIKPRR
ncbi:FlgK family flagellar hook-associated protein [Escherichia coli]